MAHLTAAYSVLRSQVLQQTRRLLCSPAAAAVGAPSGDTTCRAATTWAAPPPPTPVGLDADAVVIGAGVIGLAIARELALAGHSVLLLEAAGAIGTETSSRNSEVIHAGEIPGSRLLCQGGPTGVPRGVTHGHLPAVARHA